MDDKKRTHNSTFAIGRVSCSTESFVIDESFVLRINICGKNQLSEGYFLRMSEKRVSPAETHSKNIGKANQTKGFFAIFER